MSIGATLGSHLIDTRGSRVEASTLNGKYVGIYFSAHWCGPCRAFTPILADAYRSISRDGGKLEIVFASADRSESDFRSYFAEMPWLALPFGSARVQALMGQYGVRGFPTLLIFDPTGKKVLSEGRELFTRQGSRAYASLVSQYGQPTAGGLAGRSGGYTLGGNPAGGSSSDGRQSEASAAGAPSSIPARAQFQPRAAAASASDRPVRDISQTVARVAVGLLIVFLAWKWSQGAQAGQ